MTSPSEWSPPFPLCSASQPNSFAYTSTVSRWPTIITSIIDHLATLNHSLLSSSDAAKLAESKLLINKLGQLIYEMRHDRELTPLVGNGEEVPDDLKLYNDQLASMALRGENKWFTSSWLFAECYLYRRIRLLFSLSPHWASFDPFFASKMNAFKSSGKGVMQLAETMEELIKKGKTEDEEELRVEWEAMLETNLWGNATDLSLLTSLSHADIVALQSVQCGSSFILKNDFARVWSHVKNLRGERFDIVLDNSGFELFTDLLLCDFLLSLTPFCSQIVLHPKLIPWFVSDVVPHDLEALLDALEEEEFFEGVKTTEEVKRMVGRWRAYVEQGRIRLSVKRDLGLGEKGGEMADFWTSPFSFSHLPTLAPSLLASLQTSALTIFKGDLNYRKLTSDALWPSTTSFEDTLGPLRGKISLLSLRTCKATVCVGLEEGVEERLDREAKDWRVSGKYAVVSFSGKE